MEKTSKFGKTSELVNAFKEMLLYFFLICEASGNCQSHFKTIERKREERDKKKEKLKQQILLRISFEELSS